MLQIPIILKIILNFKQMKKKWTWIFFLHRLTVDELNRFICFSGIRNVAKSDPGAGDELPILVAFAVQ